MLGQHLMTFRYAGHPARGPARSTAARPEEEPQRRPVDAMPPRGTPTRTARDKQGDGQVIYRNQSIDRLFAIMEVLGRSPYHVRLADVARRCGLAPPTAYRMLSVMVRLGYVSKDPASGHYALGTRLYRLAHRETYLRSLLKLAQPRLQALAAQIGEVVHIGAFDGVQVVIRARVAPANSLRVATRVGMRIDAHATALGKAMLATRPIAEIEDLFGGQALARYTAQTLITSTQLQRDLIETRRRGFAVSRSERFEHVWCAAAPVLNSLGVGNIAISACMSAVGVASRDAERVGKLVRAIALEIQEAFLGSAELANQMG
jgi:IclR family transcriptional regulator, acetate operon repressor